MRISNLEKTIKEQRVKGRPPVHLWNPPYCGDIGLRISRGGTWYYQNSPIGRKSLVKLFASVLRKDDDGNHYLVTPAEKIRINVEDSPFQAVEMKIGNVGQEQTLTFRTDVDDEVTVNNDHPLRFQREADTGGYKPYILVRGRLEARVTRSLYYDLIELVCPKIIDGQSYLGVWSGGSFFPIAPLEQSGL